MTNSGPNLLDIRIDAFTAGVDSPVFVRATHMPTGLKGESDADCRSKLTARRQAMERLAAAWSIASGKSA